MDQVSIQKDILAIRLASTARDHWAVLGIPPMSPFKQIKSAQRRWIRKLHPDLWYASADEDLRAEIQEAYYEVQAAYFVALRNCASGLQSDPAQPGPIRMPQPDSARTLFQRLCLWIHRWLDRQVEKPT